MRKNYFAHLLLLLVLSASCHNVVAQNLRNRADSPIGTIGPGGLVRDANYSTFCTFESDNSIQDAHHVLLGYLQRDGRVQDKTARTIGYIKRDGTVQDGNGYGLGTIDKNGRVEDANHNHIGNVRLGEVALDRAAVVYFFFKLPR